MGVEDRIGRLARVMRLQQHRMANVTKVVRKIAEDKNDIIDTTTHYLSIIKSQADVIKEQNKSMAGLAMRVRLLAGIAFYLTLCAERQYYQLREEEINKSVLS